MGKTSRDSGWKRINMELIRIFFQTVLQNHKNWPRLLKNLFLTKYLHKGSKKIFHFSGKFAIQRPISNIYFALRI